MEIKEAQIEENESLIPGVRVGVREIQDDRKRGRLRRRRGRRSNDEACCLSSFAVRYMMPCILTHASI
jgi:hypothetical protein